MNFELTATKHALILEEVKKYLKLCNFYHQLIGFLFRCEICDERQKQADIPRIIALIYQSDYIRKLAKFSVNSKELQLFFEMQVNRTLIQMTNNLRECDDFDLHMKNRLIYKNHLKSLDYTDNSIYLTRMNSDRFVHNVLTSVNRLS